MNGEGGVTRFVANSSGTNATGHGNLAAALGLGNGESDLELAAVFFEGSAAVSNGDRFAGVPARLLTNASNTTSADTQAGDKFHVAGADAVAWLPARVALWAVEWMRWQQSPAEPGSDETRDSGGLADESRAPRDASPSSAARRGAARLRAVMRVWLRAAVSSVDSLLLALLCAVVALMWYRMLRRADVPLEE